MAQDVQESYIQAGIVPGTNRFSTVFCYAVREYENKRAGEEPSDMFTRQRFFCKAGENAVILIELSVSPMGFSISLI